MKTMIIVGGKEIRVEGKVVRIARLEGDRYHFLGEPQVMIDALRNCGTRIDLFTFIQKLPDKEPKYKYPMEWDNAAVLPISTFDNWWNKQINFKARNKAKQAEKKGVVLREVLFDDDLVKGIWEIYNECPVRQGRPFLHYGKGIDTIRRISGTFLEHSIFIGAYLEQKLIGFIKLTTDEQRTMASTMHIISMIQHRDKAPTNALVAQAVKSCAERGIGFLVYANFAYGKKQPDSVADFKERNGFQRMDLPRYYVPLTATGSAAFHLGLHHRLVDLFPAPIVAKLRQVRNNWYNRKLQPANEIS
jgi:hypothetical protein